MPPDTACFQAGRGSDHSLLAALTPVGVELMLDDPGSGHRRELNHLHPELDPAPDQGGSTAWARLHAVTIRWRPVLCRGSHFLRGADRAAFLVTPLSQGSG